jgi:hypothetical protein
MHTTDIHNTCILNNSASRKHELETKATSQSYQEQGTGLVNHWLLTPKQLMLACPTRECTANG